MMASDNQQSEGITIVALGRLGSEIFGIDTQKKHISRIEVDDRRSFDKVPMFATAHTAVAVIHHGYDLARPELVFANNITTGVAAVPKRKIRSLLDHNIASNSTQLLGQRGPSISYATLEGNFPSIALVKVGNKVSLERNPRTKKLSATFPFGAAMQSFPIVDTRATSTYPNDLDSKLSYRDLCQCLGYKPTYLLLALARVHHGYCKKVVVSLIPEP